MGDRMNTQTFNPGEAATASHIENRARLREVRQHRQAVEKMQDDHLLALAHSSEVVDPVPLLEQAEERSEALDLRR